VPQLIYSSMASLDGYVADAGGGFDWAVPDAEVLAFISDLERPVGTYLYGRRLYEMMIGWENDHAVAQRSPEDEDFAAVWQQAEKIVYSRTLQEAPTSGIRIERSFDPDAVRQLKASATTDLTVGGDNLAAHALRAGLVDEVHLFLAPVVVGGGKPFFPGNVRMDLELL
jgi:dihydrofolate reductase